MACASAGRWHSCDIGRCYKGYLAGLPIFLARPEPGLGLSIPSVRPASEKAVHLWAFDECSEQRGKRLIRLHRCIHYTCAHKHNALARAAR